MSPHLISQLCSRNPNLVIVSKQVRCLRDIVLICHCDGPCVNESTACIHDDMWHFIPNRHSFPFWVRYISGPRAFSALFVELGH